MRQVVIGPNEAGQRLDKFLHKYMKEAPSGFFYKMMRKKNIVLNGAKCSGNEKLKEGDFVKFFLAEETLEKFGALSGCPAETDEYESAFAAFGLLPVVYEDRHMLAVNKPAGILSQKAKPSDLSLNEWLIGYLLKKRETDPAKLATFRPSVCNRLDRNTSGLVLCGKSLEGTQLLTQAIRERSVRKFYRLFVKGRLTKEEILCAWLKKDAKSNQVQILDHFEPGGEPIKTGIRPLQSGLLPGGMPVTYAEAELFTGKTHQIRAHLASIGHPLLGDLKYGEKRINEVCTKFGVKNQMLHAYRVEFPDSFKEPDGNSLVITAPLPECFEKLLTEMVDHR
ncbi:MAG: RluA family pseudouridine synthase [Eubacteriales bacterium]|nr:RluA family pseudouridine synthase [Eubacteriales bacterium]